MLVKRVTGDVTTLDELILEVTEYENSSRDQE